MLVCCSCMWIFNFVFLAICRLIIFQNENKKRGKLIRWRGEAIFNQIDNVVSKIPWDLAYNSIRHSFLFISVTNFYYNFIGGFYLIEKISTGVVIA